VTLSSAPARSGPTPEFRASLFHASVYLSNGILAAYLAPWMTSKGLSAEQIGIVNAAPIFLVLISTVFIGRLADRASDWRVVITILSVIAALTSLGFIGVTGFWAVLFVFTVCSTPINALLPVLDAATLHLTERRGTHFADVRVWATVGYVASAAIGGVIIGWLGAVAFVPLFIGACLVRAALAFQLPKFRGPDYVPAAPAGKRAGLGEFLQPWFVLPCIAFSLINATHYFLVFMAALIWKADGVPEAYFGPLIAYSAFGEAVMMFLWPRLNLKISARTMLIIAGVVGVVRYVAMAFSPSLPLLFALQTTHAITYPFAYFGIVHFVANWTREHNAAEGQSFAFMLSQGFAVATFLTFGFLVQAIGGFTFFVAAGMCLVAAGATVVSLRMMPVHARTATTDRAH
jgi:MFS transporter, PPP family, 3-phenylpropionic acid transporter